MLLLFMRSLKKREKKTAEYLSRLNYQLNKNTSQSSLLAKKSPAVFYSKNKAFQINNPFSFQTITSTIARPDVGNPPMKIPAPWIESAAVDPYSVAPAPRVARAGAAQGVLLMLA